MFLARTILQRTQPGTRQSVKTEGYFCHVHVKDYGLGAIVMADTEYPATAAFGVVNKVLDEFLAQAGETWRVVDADDTAANTILEAALVKYQVLGNNTVVLSLGRRWQHPCPCMHDAQQGDAHVGLRQRMAWHASVFEACSEAWRNSCTRPCNGSWLCTVLS